MTNSISGNSPLSTFHTRTNNPKALATEKARLNEQLTTKKTELTQAQNEFERAKLKRMIDALVAKIAVIEKTENTIKSKQTK